ncbi:MAG: FUSC family protein [Burkholderiaceae bacterium]|jgi:uncharacterized membrane protein YccC|nr:FUSC family protein [Burkholderiaceae bacterium]
MQARAEKVIRLNFPSLPAPKEWLFSIKCFMSAAMAIYFSLKIGLTHPFWAVGTCYVIAAPLAGPVRSKGLYRSIGTVLAGLMIIFTIPLFLNYRPIYIIACSGFAGICMYVSLLDRTPRAYIFMLAGYTAAIIGTPLLNDTQIILEGTPFRTAADRVLEITIALCCSAIVHSLVFPQSIGDALLARLDQTINDARKWTADVLTGVKSANAMPQHRKLAQDITELRMMATHLPFDTHNIRWTTQVVQALYDRLSTLVPLVSGIENRIAALTEGLSEIRSTAWRTLLGDIASWCQRGRSSPERVRNLKNRINELLPETSAEASWEQMLLINLASELHLMIDAFEACYEFRYRIEVGVKKGVIQEVPGTQTVPNRVLHVDKGQALMAAAGVTISTIICYVLWYVTDWPTGCFAPMYACIMSSIFAAMDNPAPGLKVAFRYTSYSIPFAVLYLTILIPSTHTIEMLLLMMAPFFLWMGIYIGRPATAGAYLIMLMAVVGLLMLYDFGQADMTSYINGQIAQLVGIGVGLFVVRILRNVDLERIIRRITRSGWEDIARMARTMRPVSVAVTAVRMIDRVNLLAPRLAAVESQKGPLSLGLMEDIRVSVNLTFLLDSQEFLAENGMSSADFMTALADYFNAKLKQAQGDGRALLIQLDRLLYQICALPSSEGKNRVMAALAGIRKDIFPNTLFLKVVVSRRDPE